MGVISWHNYFKTMGRIASGPAALETLQGRRRLLESGTAIEHCWCSPSADDTRGEREGG